MQLLDGVGYIVALGMRDAAAAAAAVRGKESLVIGRLQDEFSSFKVVQVYIRYKTRICCSNQKTKRTWRMTTFRAMSSRSIPGTQITKTRTCARERNPPPGNRLNHSGTVPVVDYFKQLTKYSQF